MLDLISKTPCESQPNSLTRAFPIVDNQSDDGLEEALKSRCRTCYYKSSVIGAIAGIAAAGAFVIAFHLRCSL